jgi:hypothetical protein
MMYFIVILGYHMKNIEKRHGSFSFAFRKMKCTLLLGNKILAKVGMHNMYECVICLQTST